MAVGGSSLKFLAGLLVAAAAILLVVLWRSSPDPTVSAAYPAPRSTIPAGATTVSIEIQGAAPLADASLMLDGDRVIPTLDRLSASRWRVSYEANIAPGSHRAEVIAHDIHQRAQHFDWQFSVAADEQPPQITQVLPAPGRAITPGQVEFSAVILDRTPLTAATLQVGDRLLALQIASTPSPEGPAESIPSQRLVARTSLAAGRYQVALVVRDSNGHLARYSWQVIVSSMGA